MFPISIAGSIVILAPSGAVSPASTRAHVGPGRLEVAPGLDAAQVQVRLVAAGHQPAQALERLVGHHLHRARPRGR